MISLPIALPFVVLVLIVLANAVSTLLGRGFSPCPDDPTGYALLAR